MFYVDGNIFELLCVCEIGIPMMVNFRGVLQLYIDEVMQLKYQL